MNGLCITQRAWGVICDPSLGIIINQTNMMTKSGALVLNKKDRKDLETLIYHVERDLSYGSEGSFGDGDKVNKSDIKKVERALSGLKWIMNI